MKSTLEPTKLQEIVNRIVEIAHPDRIVLFGSAARGDMTSDSDVDLLVIKSDVKHRGELTEEIYKNLIGVDHAVDIIVVSPEDIDRYGDAIGLVLKPALQEGQEIYAAN